MFPYQFFLFLPVREPGLIFNFFQKMVTIVIYLPVLVFISSSTRNHNRSDYLPVPVFLFLPLQEIIVNLIYLPLPLFISSSAGIHSRSQCLPVPVFNFCRTGIRTCAFNFFQDGKRQSFQYVFPYPLFISCSTEHHSRSQCLPVPVFNLFSFTGNRTRIKFLSVRETVVSLAYLPVPVFYVFQCGKRQPLSISSRTVFSFFQ